MVMLVTLWFAISVGQVQVHDGDGDSRQPAVSPDQPPDRTASLPDLQSLFVRLSSGDESAEKELIQLGPDVLAHLPAIQEETPEVVRARLIRVRRALEQQVVDKLAQPTRVTLSGRMKLSEALAEIYQQTGNRVIDNRESYGYNAPDPDIETDVVDSSFWEALETLFRRANVGIDPNVLEPGALGYVAAGDSTTSPSTLVRYSGRFRFEPLRAEAYRNLRDPSDNLLRVGLEISWEPISAPVALVYRPDTMSAYSEHGESLKLAGPDELMEVPVHESGSAVEIDLPFELPESGVESIKSLSGIVDAMIPGQFASFEFAKLGEGRVQTQSHGGVTVTLQRAREAQNLIDIWILIRIHHADEMLQSHRGWVYNNPAQLVGPDGQKHDFVGMDTFRQAPTEFGISYKFDVMGDLKDYRFTYRTPAAILTVPVAFELNGIRLP